MTRLHSMLEARTSESPTPAGCGQKLEDPGVPRTARQGARPRQRLLDREDPLVERLADHHGRRAPVGTERVEILEPRHAARGDHRAGGQRSRQPRRRVEVRARAHAVAPDVGVEHGAGARARDRQARPRSRRRSVCSVQPSTEILPSRASTAITIRCGQRAQAASTIAGSLTAAVPSTTYPTPEVEQARAVVERPHAAARLDLRTPAAATIFFKRRLVVDARVGAAGERGVEIDDVNPRGARGGEARRHLPGRAVVDLGALAAPLFEAHRRAAQ